MTAEIKRLIQRFLVDRTGATAIEYGLIVALLGMVIAGAASVLGNHLYTILNNVSSVVSH